MMYNNKVLTLSLAILFIFSYSWINSDTTSDVIIDTSIVNIDSSSSLSETVKIMAYNIKESGESSTHPDWKDVVKEENADVIMFVETGYWDDSSNAKLNQYITEFNNYFSSEDPYVGYTTQGISYSTSGEAIMSRYPIVSTNQIANVPLDDSSSYDVTHDFLDVVVDISGTDVHILGAHLKAMTGSENEERREWEQEGIINYMDNYPNDAFIYMGDLNSFSPEDIGINNDQSGLGYGPCTMLVDQSDTHSSTAHTFTDVHRTLNPYALGISNPAYDSRIDFVYVNQYLSNKIVSSTTGDTASALTGSDHLTVDVLIDFESSSPTDDGGELINGVAATGHMDSSDGSDMYWIQVAANAESMNVVLECGSADFDTYGRAGYEPTTSTYDWRGYTSGGEDNTVTSPASGTYYIMVDYYSGDADYTLTATITYGSTSDTTAPTVSISSPSNGATVSGTTTISFSASDANGISSYGISIGGSTVSTSNSYSWDTTSYSDSSYTIQCRATDPSGNTGYKSISVTVSNGVSTDDGGLLNNGVTATGHMDSSDGSDMYWIQVAANAESMNVVLECGSADFDTYGRAGYEPTTSTYDWRGYTSGGEDNTVTSPASGTYYIMVDYYSGDADYTLTATITYGSTSDTTAPTVSISSPSNGATVSGTTTISFSASDANGISSYGISIGGSTVSTSNSYSWDTTSYSDSSYTIQCRATDPSGNTGYKSISVTVSNGVSTDDGGLLNNGVTATGHMDSSDGSDMYWIQVAANAESMNVVLECGSADFDTYGRAGYEPTTSTYDWRGYTSGGEDNTVTSPASGTYYIMVDYYSGDSDYTLTVTITYGSTSTQILISEVYYDATGTDSSNEWLELYNAGSSTVDLSGWTLSDNYATWTIPSGTTIQSNQYLVIARTSSGFESLHGFSPDVVGLSTSLGNSGDKLTLKDDSGTEMDFVAWENYVSGWNIYAGTGSTIARATMSDTDTVADWEVVTGEGTPGTG